MNPLHQFALALVVLIVAGSLFLAIVRQVAGRRWAAILEAIRGLLFWSIAWILFTIWAYFLQATTLAKLTRPEPIGLGEHLLSFLHQGVHLTTPYVMAFILMLFAAAGGFLVATHLDIILGLIGLATRWNDLSPYERAGFVQNLFASIIFTLIGLVMVYADACVFSLRWAMDISEIETEVRGVPLIANLIRWGYFLGFIALSWIVHRKYRQFLLATRIEEPEEEEQNVRMTTRVSQQASTSTQLQQGSIVTRETEGAQQFVGSPFSNRQSEQPMRVSRNDGSEGILEGIDIPAIEAGNGSDGIDGEDVLPEHLNPFGRRR